ncbi:MAG: uncharacterized DUF497 family protein [Rubritalea sp.]|jgi:uncharacterized DUF497 family protein
MEFEYDPEKSNTNKEKHGLDFEEAQALWFDPDNVGFVAKSDDEHRFAIIGGLKKKLWVGFYTLRENRIRIISVRRARPNERKLYES